MADKRPKKKSPDAQSNSKIKKILKIGGITLGSVMLTGALGIGGFQGTQRLRIHKHEESMTTYVKNEDYANAAHIISEIKHSMGLLSKYNFLVFKSDFSKDINRLEMTLDSVSPKKLEERLNGDLAQLDKNPGLLDENYAGKLGQRIRHIEEGYTLQKNFNALGGFRTGIKPKVQHHISANITKEISALVQGDRFWDAYKRFSASLDTFNDAKAHFTPEEKVKISELAGKLYLDLCSKHVTSLEELSQYDNPMALIQEKKGSQKKVVMISAMESEYKKMRDISNDIAKIFHSIGVQYDRRLDKVGRKYLADAYNQFLINYTSDLRLLRMKQESNTGEIKEIVTTLEAKLKALEGISKRTATIAAGDFSVSDSLAKAKDEIVMTSKTILDSRIGTLEVEIENYTKNPIDDSLFLDKVAIGQKEAEKFYDFFRSRSGDKAKSADYKDRLQRLKINARIEMIKDSLAKGEKALTDVETTRQDYDDASEIIIKNSTRAQTHLAFIVASLSSQEKVTALDNRVKKMSSYVHLMKCHVLLKDARNNFAEISENNDDNGTEESFTDGNKKLSECEKSIGIFRLQSHDEEKYKNVLEKVKSIRVFGLLQRSARDLNEGIDSYEKSISYPYDEWITRSDMKNAGDEYIDDAKGYLRTAVKLTGEDAPAKALEERIKLVEIIPEFLPINKAVYELKETTFSEIENTSLLNRSRTYIKKRYNEMVIILNKHKRFSTDTFYRKMETKTIKTVADAYSRLGNHAVELGNKLKEPREVMSVYVFAENCLASAKALDNSYQDELDGIRKQIIVQKGLLTPEKK